MASRKEVYEAIDEEREYQDKVWNQNTTSSGGKHSFEEWIIYMEDYLEEAKRVLSRSPSNVVNTQVCHIMRKVVAMGVNSLEQNGVIKRDGDNKPIYIECPRI